MKVRDYIIIAFILLIAGGTGGFFVAKGIYQPKKSAIQLPQYFPVVVTVPKYIEKPVPYSVIIPPHITTHFLAYADSMKMVKANDSLICLLNADTLKRHDTIKIHTKFLTAFPLCPKLINIDLNLDSISVTTLNINADLNTYRYPLVLLGYKYRFDGKDMSVEKLKTTYGTPKESSWEWEVLPRIAYNIFDKNFSLIGEAGISFKNVTGIAELGINTSREIEFNAGIGYKFHNK